ncbi:MAG: glycosyltransferase family 9 protein [Phycisphaerales bacterium]|nr:glycosyltransferase family 9 protein [Phycisphaerales bacterium]
MIAPPDEVVPHWAKAFRDEIRPSLPASGNGLASANRPAPANQTTPIPQSTDRAGSSSRAERILVLALGGIGDTVMAFAMMRRLRRLKPCAQITALAMWPQSADLLIDLGVFDEVLQHHFQRASWLSSLRVADKLRRRRFDISVQAYPANRAEYNAVHGWIGARRRIGHDYHTGGRRTCLRGLLTDLVPQRPGTHNIVENLRLLGPLGDPVESWKPGDCDISLGPIDPRYGAWADRATATLAEVQAPECSDARSGTWADRVRANLAAAQAADYHDPRKGARANRAAATLTVVQAADRPDLRNGARADWAAQSLPETQAASCPHARNGAGTDRVAAAPPRSLLGIHAGSSSYKNLDGKRWPAEHFAELCRRAARELGLTPVLLGTRQDRPVNDRILRLAPEARLIEPPTIRHAAALIQRCSAFVSNDSAPAHLAKALSVPTIMLVGPTDPAEIGHWGTPGAVVRADLPCAPCYRASRRSLQCSHSNPYKCTEAIALDDVEALLFQLLSFSDRDRDLLPRGNESPAGALAKMPG